VSITRSELSPAGTGVIIGGAYPLRFEGNTVRQALPYPAGINCGANFNGVTNGTIADNVFDCTAYDGTALAVQATVLIRVERNALNGFDTLACLRVEGRSVLKDNTIQGCRYALSSAGSESRIVGNTISSVSALGYGMDVDGSNNTVANNAVSDYLYGPTVHGSGNRISGNSVLLSAERGVTIVGTENLISGNRIQSGTWDFSKGLVFLMGSSANVYKNNDLTGTTGPPD
jgi:parallel beta-helix repeat protein